ncbi:hypothetical protein G6F42_021020 [Rhizopus arrhizus]|nr:hypothetical protein G6F42_021020 [Rhizopus arrhizus]
MLQLILCLVFSAPGNKPRRTTQKRQRTNAQPAHQKKAPSVETTLMMGFEAKEESNGADVSSMPDAVDSDFPDASSLPSYASSNKDIEPDEPVLASLVVGQANCTDDYTGAIAINPSRSVLIDASSVAFQHTTLTVPVTAADHILRKALYCKLPDERRHELALLAHFISEQLTKKDKIDQELNSLFGSTLKAAHNKATILDEASFCDQDTSDTINHLISKGKEQRLEAISVNNVLKLKGIPSGGSYRHKRFFDNAITHMEERVNQLSETVSMLEETVNGFDPNVQFTPQYLGTMLNHQNKVFMSLASRVADIHQAVACLSEHYRISK